MQANSTLNDKVEIRSRHNLGDQTRAKKERFLLREKHPQAIADSGNNNNLKNNDNTSGRPACQNQWAKMNNPIEVIPCNTKTRYDTQ